MDPRDNVFDPVEYITILPSLLPRRIAVTSIHI